MDGPLDGFEEEYLSEMELDGLTVGELEGNELGTAVGIMELGRALGTKKVGVEDGRALLIYI